MLALPVAYCRLPIAYCLLPIALGAVAPHGHGTGRGISRPRPRRELSRVRQAAPQKHLAKRPRIEFAYVGIHEKIREI